MLSISAYWVGSNKPICSLMQSQPVKYAKYKGFWLQRLVASLIDAKPENVKILLQSPTGPQLTPVLLTDCTKVCAAYKLKAWQAAEKAWTELESISSGVVNVYVTQHAAADVAIDNMIRAHLIYGGSQREYDRMSEELRGNPKVALAAIRLNRYPGSCMGIRIPPALYKNKLFMLQLAQTLGGAGMQALSYAHPDLRKDKDLVLAVVSCHSNNICFAALELLDDRDVVLAAMRKSGFHYKRYATSFANDREVVLAAVSSYGPALADVPPVFQCMHLQHCNTTTTFWRCFNIIKARQR